MDSLLPCNTWQASPSPPPAPAGSSAWKMVFVLDMDHTIIGDVGDMGHRPDHLPDRQHTDAHMIHPVHICHRPRTEATED